MATNGRYLTLLWFSCSLFCINPPSSLALITDTLVQGRQLKDWEQLVSHGKTFTLGFFSPGTSKNRYLGIWYNLEGFLDGNEKIVWIASRNTPILDSSGMLEIDEFGKLKISYSSDSNIMLNSVQAQGNASAILLDSGNFVLRELNSGGNVKRVLWQSFDHPTDTLLPGMKLGANLKTGQTWSLSSWISNEDPAPGSFKFGIDPNGTSQLIVWWRGSVFRTTGLWNNGQFEFAPQLSYEHRTFSYISNENEVLLMFSANNFISGYKISSDGEIRDVFGTVFESGKCSFLGTVGCLGEKLPECRKPNYQFNLKKGHVFDYEFRFDKSLNLSLFDCQAKCLNNCSCVAYASTNDNKTGCMIWSKGMSFIEGNNAYDIEIYVLADLEETTTEWWIWLITSGILPMLVLFLTCNCIDKECRREGKIDPELEILYELVEPAAHADQTGAKNIAGWKVKKSQELQFFSYESIASATNDFSSENKLGEGGFGPVFKGTLHDGQEVAIKRLSKNSTQGLVEFKNEAVVIAKLQHTNLVRLLGCCIQKKEKMLIYEYMPNRSLDLFLYDSEKKNSLDWKKRFNIIEGIAQGLLYLHKYSRLRIIHRDLKAGNILLDNEMNPKISDFGMARIVGPNECQTNTERVVGTYGYMSPEYAMEGIFSTKSDVFSFGVLLLEIVSGRKNNSFRLSGGLVTLIGYAWNLWKEGRGLELTDPAIGDSYQNAGVLSCIHVGLLCVQDNATDRPSMLDVTSMIHNEACKLPMPKQPAFYKVMNILEEEFVECKPQNCSLNRVSISEMEAR